MRKITGLRKTWPGFCDWLFCFSDDGKGLTGVNGPNDTFTSAPSRSSRRDGWLKVYFTWARRNSHLDAPVTSSTAQGCGSGGSAQLLTRLSGYLGITIDAARVTHARSCVQSQGGETQSVAPLHTRTGSARSGFTGWGNSIASDVVGIGTPESQEEVLRLLPRHL